VSSPLRALHRPALEGLALTLETAPEGAALPRAKVAQHVPPSHLDAVCDALAALQRDGMAPRHMAHMLRLLAEERLATQRLGDRLELVWTPRALDQVEARDTAVVAQELFRAARHSVLVVTYVLDAKKKAEHLFGELAARMDTEPELRVRFVVNVERPYGDATPAAEIVRKAARRLRQEVWPGERLPEVYYDPRALDEDMQQRASMHAKCIVVDAARTLLTSANLTEAAQARNIEAGVLVEDTRFAERVERQFGRLVESGGLRRLGEA
jgi:phosphatidylserine/phosphatidylglycerophosphate/cardiolipin synthase-like enzyme